MPLPIRSEEHTSELQSLTNLVCRLLLEKKKRATNVSAGDGRGFSPSRLHVRSTHDALLHSHFFNDTAATEIYTLALHDALPICTRLNSSHCPISYAVFCFEFRRV